MAPALETPNMDAGKRDPVQHATAVSECREERGGLEAKFVEANVDTSLATQALALIDRLLDLAT
ncbi:MAG TPA: hypothetical protein VMY35_19575 [Phycisphaerae bacterium]|nr:hypothetical protein [Phycisphaerae bacterium]